MSIPGTGEIVDFTDPISISFFINTVICGYKSIQKVKKGFARTVFEDDFDTVVFK